MNPTISHSMSTVQSLMNGKTLANPPAEAIGAGILTALEKASANEQLFAAFTLMQNKPNNKNPSLQEIAENAKETSDAAVQLVKEPISEPSTDLSVASALLNSLRALRSEHRSLVASMYAANDSEADLAKEIAFRTSEERSKYVARSLENAKVRLKASRDQLAFLDKQLKSSKKVLDDTTKANHALTEARVAYDITLNSVWSDDAEATNLGVLAVNETPEGKVLEVAASGSRRAVAAFGQAYLYYVASKRGVSSLQSEVLAIAAAREQSIQSMKSAEAQIEFLAQQSREEARALEMLQTSHVRATQRKASLISNFDLRLESLLLEYSSAAIAMEAASQRLFSSLDHVGITYLPFSAGLLLANDENDEKLIAEQFAQLSRIAAQLSATAPFCRTVKISVPLPPLQWEGVTEFPVARRFVLNLSFNDLGPSALVSAWLRSPDSISAQFAVRAQPKELLSTERSFAWLPLVHVNEDATVSAATHGLEVMRGIPLPTPLTLEVAFRQKPTQRPFLELVVRCYGQ